VLRLLDLVIAGSAAIITSPAWVLIAILMKLSSPRGPVLYRGWRVGRSGHLFQMLKFRTLKPDAEQRLGPFLGPELTQLTQNETTKFGRILRASKLDELPQLLNVLRGDMSLVGPRPIRPTFFGQLCEEVPEYWQRLVIRPGVTGLAQLRLTREMTWAEKLAHDLEYIADRSPGLYLSVIATTVWLIIMRPANRSAALNRLP
jgi:lipopolysaccharide/colanic/teichoic acid biosynthesis glycosyltransferase